MLLPNRSGSSDSYRYGYNGMEKDDEVSGEGNSYTTHFRQLDPRIGRWFSTDPVYKEFISPYNSMSNSPIMRVDPRGDDDYFDAFGNYLGSDDRTTNNIIILRDLVPHGNTYTLYKWVNSETIIDSDVALKYDYTDLMSLNYKSSNNKRILENVGNHYLKQIGVTNKKVESGEHETANAYVYDSRTYPDEIFIGIDGSGMITPIMNDAMNFQNVLVHENDHFNGNTDRDLQHTDMYLTQMQHSTFEGVTEDYRKGIIYKIQKYLNSALENETSTIEEVKTRIDVVNEYSFNLDLGGELFYNGENNKVIIFIAMEGVDLGTIGSDDGNDGDDGNED